MNEAQALIELLGKTGGWGLLVVFFFLYLRGELRAGREVTEQDKRHELEIANLKAAHAETVLGLKDRLLSDTTSSREQIAKLEKKLERFELLATRAVTTTEAIAGAANTKPPGAEM